MQAAGGFFRVLISVDQEKGYTKEASPKRQAGNIMKLLEDIFQALNGPGHISFRRDAGNASRTPG